ncbi:hypothetical protein EGR_08515 [Echinococcus granulosus]|uniref:Uncharacterized protein n=1 Tax=Echinococcus granulosus TaxID=6210 RepID=W6UTC9_ECHGR|nr:hypothetical protein EGR_08515 [Echinococcus granulosus]EUB56654.1 hypothetical protein EGR_08515 [Echinococcus granulosus]
MGVSFDFLSQKTLRDQILLDGTSQLLSLISIGSTSLALHPDRITIATGQTAGHGKCDGKVRHDFFLPVFHYLLFQNTHQLLFLYCSSVTF